MPFDEARARTTLLRDGRFAGFDFILFPPPFNYIIYTVHSRFHAAVNGRGHRPWSIISYPVTWPKTVAREEQPAEIDALETGCFIDPYPKLIAAVAGIRLNEACSSAA